MTKELERFAKIEAPTRQDTDEPDPFMPPPEPKAPIILDLSDQDDRAAQQAAREAKAKAALEMHRQAHLARVQAVQLEVGDSDDVTMTAWRATARWPRHVRAGALAGALGVTALLAVAASPIFWIFAPVVVSWFGTTFLVRVE